MKTPGTIYIYIYIYIHLWAWHLMTCSVVCSSSVVLKYKLLHAQQREVILTRHCGEQETAMRVKEGEVRALKEENIDLKRQMALGQVRCCGDTVGVAADAVGVALD